MSMGAKVKRIRESRKMERKDLAKVCGVAISYISFIERDRPVHCSPRVADEINKCLGMTVISKQALQKHNDRAAKYVRDWRAKRAGKKSTTKKAA